MGTAYRWINALRVVFVVGRFAGLFHLARTEVYRSSMGGSLLALVDDPTRVRLRLRARKLLVFMTGLAVMAVVLGMWLLGQGAVMKAGWMEARLLPVLPLIGYHGWCGVLYTSFAQGLLPGPMPGPAVQ